MIYLLDTDILIFMIRGLKSNQLSANKRRALKLVDRCRKAQGADHSVALSALTISELEYGARKGGQYESEMTAVQKVLTPFDIYDYDSIFCPLLYGRIRHDLESKGVSIGSMDLLIAAHALALDAVLVSNNVVHFSRVVGLKMETWT